MGLKAVDTHQWGKRKGYPDCKMCKVCGLIRQPQKYAPNYVFYEIHPEGGITGGGGSRPCIPSLAHKINLMMKDDSFDLASANNLYPNIKHRWIIPRSRRLTFQMGEIETTQYPTWRECGDCHIFRGINAWAKTYPYLFESLPFDKHPLPDCTPLVELTKEIQSILEES